MCVCVFVCVRFFVLDTHLMLLYIMALLIVLFCKQIIYNTLFKDAIHHLSDGQ